VQVAGVGNVVSSAAFFLRGGEGALRGIPPPKKIAAEEFMGNYVENTLQHLTLFVCFEREQSPASSR